MKKLIPQHRHWVFIAWLLAAYDFIAVLTAYTGALLLRFDLRFSAIPPEYWHRHILAIWPCAAGTVLVLYFFKLYKSMWRFASYHELLHSLVANGVCFLGYVVPSMIWFRMPISYYVFGGMALFCLTTGIRFAYRFVNLIRSRSHRGDFTHRVMVIGAGASGQMLVRDMINGGSDPEDKVVCIIDDNPNKWGRFIDNIPIVGGRETIFENVAKHHIDRIYFAIATISAEDRRELLQICTETGCELKTLPALHQMISGEVTVSDLKEVPIEDLLGREPIAPDMAEVFSQIRGKTVLVTGGGGSIGSELCRQVAANDPKTLIIFDVYENNAYSIQLELREKYPDLHLVTLIGSVRDSRRVNQVFQTYRPDIVYHAAAHKHVPLMEDSPCESIKNNVLGTYKCCMAALHNGTRRFVLISTDKAVNPTNIMGASKRLCEMVVQTFDYAVSQRKTDRLPAMYTHYEPGVGSDQLSMEGLDVPDAVTRFVAVRFGNVLGSNGSVVPLFKKQIEKGGPVTVTHPDIIRYFMTVPEAVRLVMLAGTYARGGEIFVLDMGSPVKIDTLARNLIRLSGKKPDVDIKIEYTGLRPGEKLYEEKLMAEEGLTKTENDLIHIGKPLDFDRLLFLHQMVTLEQLAYDNNEKAIRGYVQQVVTTYHPVQN